MRRETYFWGCNLRSNANDINELFLKHSHVGKLFDGFSAKVWRRGFLRIR
jgi:hypothetical protein